MFGQLLKGLLKKQGQSFIQDKLGGNASILQNLFKFTGQGNPMSDIFGDKWQEGGGDNVPKSFGVQQPLHQRYQNQNQYGNFNFKDILKVLNR